MNADRSDDDRRITYFAATHTRGKREMFGIRAEDRGKHIYVIGKTGMGKSTMLENMAIQDIQNGEGLAFIDPHGSTAEKLLDFIPHERIQDVVYFAPFDTEYPIGFNVMEDVGYDKRHLVVSGLMGALKRIWVDAWSARMEYILQNTLLALLEYPDSTLLDVNKMLTNKVFRAAVVEKITDPIVRAFWTEEFASFTDTYTREATPAIQNKVGQFTSNPLIRNIIGQPRSSFDMRKLMDEKKLFIVNLSKGRMGETNASLLGSMLVVKIYLAAMSRADETASRLAKLPRFYFYVDEFQSMMNEAFADILSESRKYKLALTLANQYIEQMEEKVRDAVFGNVGSLVCFRVGPFDAEELKTIFEPTFTAEDLVGLGIGQIYLTLMIDGVGSRPFSAETIPPIERPVVSYRDDCVRMSRERFGRARADIEELILNKQKEFTPPRQERNSTNNRNRGGARNGMPPGRQGNFQRMERPFNGREPREVFTNHAERPFAHPDSRNGSGQATSEPVGRSQAGEDEQRSALRAAIHAARPDPNEVGARAAAPSAPAPGPGRSPADILREKRARKEAAAAPPRPAADAFRPHVHHVALHAPHQRHEPRAKEARHEHPPQEQRQGEVKPHPSPRPSAPHDGLAETGEVSRETLERVLRREQ